MDRSFFAPLPFFSEKIFREKKTPKIINHNNTGTTPSDSTLLTHTPHQLPTLLLIKLLTLVFYFFHFLFLSFLLWRNKGSFLLSFCISNPLFRLRALFCPTAYYDGELLQWKLQLWKPTRCEQWKPTRCEQPTSYFYRVAPTPYNVGWNVINDIQRPQHTVELQSPERNTTKYYWMYMHLGRSNACVFCTQEWSTTTISYLQKCCCGGKCVSHQWRCHVFWQVKIQSIQANATRVRKENETSDEREFHRF